MKMGFNTWSYWREEVHAEVDEVFAQLREDAEKVVRCVRRDMVVGVVLESNAAEQEGDDAGDVQAVGEEVGRVRDKGDEA